MNRILLALPLLMFALVFAFSSVAQESWASRAVGRSRKALVGAARMSFIQKCERDTCQARAVGSNGKNCQVLQRRAS
jgi:hypothetical protein